MGKDQTTLTITIKEGLESLHKEAEAATEVVEAVIEGAEEEVEIEDQAGREVAEAALEAEEVAVGIEGPAEEVGVVGEEEVALLVASRSHSTSDCLA